MSKMSVFDHDWIDLVFEGRNQAYGAYQLRKQDSKTTAIALFSGIVLMGLAVGIPFVIGQYSDNPPTASTDFKGPTITPVDLPVYELHKPEPEQPKPATSEPEPAAPAPSLAPTVAFTPLVATSNPVIDIPNMNDLENANPGVTTNPGNSNGNPLSNSPGVPDGTGTTATTTNGPSDGLYVAVDEAPGYPGGINKFREEIGSRFRTPDIDSESLLKVTVAFVVERDGTLSNIKVTKDPGYGAAKEAIRVLQSIKTKWKPGKIKGQPVRTAYTLPITIKIN